MLKSSAMGVACWLCVLSPVAAMEISVEGRVKASISATTLSHDASRVDPTLGNPTSVLDFAPLHAVDVEFVVSGRSADPDGGWFDLLIGAPIASNGTFLDRDYNAGQILFSDTSSNVVIEGIREITGRVSLPGWHFDGDEGRAFSPYLVASGQFSRFEARGLGCNTVCAPGYFPIASDIAVIGQDTLGLEAGVGLLMTQVLDDGGSIDARVELRGGYRHVSDSHYFRLVDLGPTPNIFYDFGTIGVHAGLGYTHKLSETGALRAGLFVDGQAGFGTVVFNQAGGGTSPAMPAWSSSLSAGVTLGASFSF